MERYSLHVMVMLALLCSVGCTDVSQAVDEPGETRVAIVLKALLLAPATRAQGDIQSVQFDQGETINAYFSSGATLTENTYTTADANGTLTPVVVPYFDLTDNSAMPIIRQPIIIQALHSPLPTTRQQPRAIRPAT